MVCVKSSEKSWTVLLAHFNLSGMQVCSDFPHCPLPTGYLYCFTLEIAKYCITVSKGLLCSRNLDLSNVSEWKIHRKDKTSHLKVFLNTAFFFFPTRCLVVPKIGGLGVIQHHAICRIRKGCPFFRPYGDCIRRVFHPFFLPYNPLQTHCTAK